MFPTILATPKTIKLTDHGILMIVILSAVMEADGTLKKVLDADRGDYQKFLNDINTKREINIEIDLGALGEGMPYTIVFQNVIKTYDNTNNRCSGCSFDGILLSYGSGWEFRCVMNLSGAYVKSTPIAVST